MAELRLMTYNVRYFGHRTRGLTSTERALNGIVEAIRKLDPIPDVIALQEVEEYSVRADFGRRRQKNGHKPQLDRVVDRLNEKLAATGRQFTGRYYPSHSYKLPGNNALYTTGLGILTTAGVEVHEDESLGGVDITHRRIKATARWKQTRQCAHVRVVDKATGAALDVFNTHLSLPQFLSWRSVAFTRRMGYGPNQLHELFSVLDFIERARTSENFVLMGDFNALPGSLVHEHALEWGLVDPLSDHHSLDVKSYRQFPSAGFMNFRMRLDYMFSSPTIEWLDFEDTHEFGKPSLFHGLSDHAPIVGRARLQLPETPAPTTESGLIML